MHRADDDKQLLPYLELKRKFGIGRYFTFTLLRTPKLACDLEDHQGIRKATGYTVSPV